MPVVHDTVCVRGAVEIDDSASVGPHCVLDGTGGAVSVGAGTRLLGHVYLQGPLTIGRGNTVYPFACLGFAPQARSYDPARPGRGLVIGDDNVLREGVTISRAMTDEGPTRIGDRNYFMANAHAGHDAQVADDCTLANGAALGGHVIMDGKVTIGGNCVVHQFVRLGRGAMLSGSMAAAQDVAPFFTLTGVNVVGSVNVVGMRRQGLAPDEIQDVRWAYKMLYRRSLPPSAALRILRERADRPLIAEYVAFIEGSRRGLCPGHGKKQMRNTDG